MPAVVYSHCDAVEHGRVAVAGLGRVDHGLRKMMELCCSGGKLVSLSVELFGYGVDEPEVTSPKWLGTFSTRNMSGLARTHRWIMVQRSARTP